MYYATHQCFLTANTLYLAVFNTTHGREGVDSLTPWLLNVQVSVGNTNLYYLKEYLLYSIIVQKQISDVSKIERQIDE